MARQSYEMRLFTDFLYRNCPKVGKYIFNELKAGPLKWEVTVQLNACGCLRAQKLDFLIGRDNHFGALCVV